MSRVRIGLDIGATAVRAAELSMKSVPPTLLRVAQAPIERGAVANGEIRDPGAVADALRELWHRNKFHSKDVILGVANQRVIVREVLVQWLPDKELRESLPFQVQEFVPIPLEDAILDFHVLEEIEREGRRMLRILLVVAQKPMIEQMVAAVEAAKLKPAGLDLVPFAIVRSVGSIDGLGLGSSQSGDEALVDIGADVTSICVHAWGVPRFVRILPSGGGEITRALSKAVQVSEEDAERLKRANGSEPDRDRVDMAKRAVATRAATFAEEIRSSLEFYLGQMPGAKIGRVLVTGGGSKLSGLIGVLDEHLPAEVVAGHPFHRVNGSLDLPPETEAEVEPLLAVAVGLALPGVRG
jgi:type IV pilus assembly protein PilM